MKTYTYTLNFYPKGDATEKGQMIYLSLYGCFERIQKSIGEHSYYLWVDDKVARTHPRASRVNRLIRSLSFNIGNYYDRCEIDKKLPSRNE